MKMYSDWQREKKFVEFFASRLVCPIGQLQLEEKTRKTFARLFGQCLVNTFLVVATP